jgi:erythromycin esterase-like protein
MSRYGSRHAENSHLWPTRPRLQYDGLFFIERTQPTVALPTAHRRTASQ